jgi:hypothetical protein
MNSKKEKCLVRIRERLKQLLVVKSAYAIKQDRQDIVLLHFIERAEEIVKASLLVEALPTPLQVLCRVFCEDLFLVCWIAQSLEATKEYEEGVQAEMAKMLGVSLSNGWGVIRNRHSKEPITQDFMETQFLPKLKALKTPRTNIEQIAQRLGLQKVYDILYRASSLELHGNTFGLFLPKTDEADYIALSAIDAILDCVLATVALPRKAYDAQDILARMRIEGIGRTSS